MSQWCKDGKVLCPICFGCFYKYQLHVLARNYWGLAFYWSDLCLKCHNDERKIASPVPKHSVDTVPNHERWRINLYVRFHKINYGFYQPKHERYYNALNFSN